MTGKNISVFHVKEREYVNMKELDISVFYVEEKVYVFNANM
uniref:Uncharacterized protein n=1 Tax=Pithovirus LCPAC403 TaxID=2506596 RepID=A0A481ZF73_9VIRU|nr:MAG: hypothetical protein LCPAC403_03050 [Pithovirus LCPAC403]